MKSKDLISISILIFMIIGLIVVALCSQTPSIDNIWVINLDKDSERLEHVKKQENLLPKPIKRWKAAYGKEEDRVEITKEGVSTMLSKSCIFAENEKSSKVLNSPGEIGCWLSHKRLLTYLAKMNYPENTGHLICEDDIIVDTDFKNKWATISKNIPSDWEFVYFGIRKMHAVYVNPYVYKWKYTDDNVKRNVGTHAYLIKQSAIPKLLERLRLMTGQIDTQLYDTLSGMNVYITNPLLIDSSETLESSIEIQQKRYYDIK